MDSPNKKPPELTLDVIDTGIALVERTKAPDDRDREELGEAQRRAADLRNDYTNALIKNIDADRDMRKSYASRILRYLEIYSGSVLVVVLLCGFKPWGFNLEQSVLAALVGSTAIAAIGLVGFIARGLFQSAPSQKPDR